METPRWILLHPSTSLQLAAVTREPQRLSSSNETIASSPSLLLLSLLPPPTATHRHSTSTVLLSSTSTNLDSPTLSTEVPRRRSVTNPRTTDLQDLDTGTRSSMEVLRCMEATRRRRWVFLKMPFDTSTTSARD